MTTVTSKHIEVTPGVCGGRARIAGHRIRVQDVVVWHEQKGMSPDEIVSRYPTITLADVYAALADYHDHFHEIRRQMQEDEDLVRKMQLHLKCLNSRRFDDVKKITFTSSLYQIVIDVLTGLLSRK